MFFPRAGNKKDQSNEEDIMIGTNKFFSYCQKFKYLGTIFTPDLTDKEDIKRIK